ERSRLRRRRRRADASCGSPRFGSRPRAVLVWSSPSSPPRGPTRPSCAPPRRTSWTSWPGSAAPSRRRGSGRSRSGKRSCSFPRRSPTRRFPGGKAKPVRDPPGVARHSTRRKKIALWRLSMIEEALDPDLTPRGRGEVLRAAARAPVRWPSGDFRPVSLATLYRWLAAYRRGGLDALCPEPRRDRGRRRRRLPADVVPEALRLLEADPHQPLGFLIAVLESQYRAQGREVRIPRSTLQRRLAETKAYERIRRARNRTRRRGRFVAAEPH